MKKANRHFVTIVSKDPFTAHSCRHNELRISIDEKQAERLNAGESLVGLVPDNLKHKLGKDDSGLRAIAARICESYLNAREEADRKACNAADKEASKAAEDSVRGLDEYNSTAEYIDEKRKIAYDGAYEDAYTDFIQAKTETELNKMERSLNGDEKAMYRAMTMKRIRLLANGGAVSGVATERQIECIEGMFPTLQFFQLPVNMTLADYIREEIAKTCDCDGVMAC